MKKRNLIAILLFLLAIFSIGQNLNKPFWGEHDWNGARYGNIARNYLRYGLINLKIAQIENSGPINNQQFEYYTHFPPLLPLLIALSYLIFGISEWSTRLIPLLATTGTIVLIFLIGSKLWDLKIGILASLLALATPMVLYFGKNPVHEPLTLFFILLAFSGYLSKLQGAKYGMLIFIIGLVLAEITSWAGYFLVPAITIVSLLKRDFGEVKKIIPFWILSILMFFIHWENVYFTTGSISGGKLFEALFQRSGISLKAQPKDFSLLNYLTKIRLWFSTLFSLTLTFLVAIWILSRKFMGINQKDWFLIILGSIGLIYSIVFSNALFIHNYLTFYFLPFFALSGALALESFKKIKVIRKIHPAIIMAVIILVVLERRNFVVSLNNSQGDKFAVEVGKVINRQTNFDDTILISPIKFSYSADKFLKFYSDRNLTYSDDDNLNSKIKVLIDTDRGKFEIIKK